MRSASWLLSPILLCAAAACSGSGFSGALPTTAGEDDASVLDEDAGASNEASSPTPAATTCKGTRADCNKAATDGCEVDTSSNPKHCGACGHACATGAVCALGKCESKCPSQLKTCGSACVDTSIDVDHCGSCTNACTAPANATTLCEASQCGFQCNPGYDACSSGCCSKPPPPPTPQLQAGAALAAGGNHTCAIGTGGALKCWGSNGSGKLGDNTMSDRRIATKVSGLSSGVSAVGCGDIHTCAMLATGEIRCWGGNTFGQLGTSNGDSSSIAKVPMTVTGLSSGAIALGVGRDFACAIVTGGGVKCWGANNHGQLGDGSTSDSSSPVDVAGLARPAVALALGSAHACALHDNGTMSCWGSNDHGQLGDGSTDDSASPVDVPNLPTGFVSATGGFSHTCVRTGTGFAHCWGDNGDGQVGDGTAIDRAAPTPVLNVTDVAALDSGSFHNCMVTNAGTMKCWGSNSQGQLGNGSTNSAATAVDVVGLLPASMTDVASGAAHTCARTQGGNIKCWGSNSRGQLGNGTTVTSAVPVNVQGF